MSEYEKIIKRIEEDPELYSLVEQYFVDILVAEYDNWGPLRPRRQPEQANDK